MVVGKFNNSRRISAAEPLYFNGNTVMCKDKTDKTVQHERDELVYSHVVAKPQNVVCLFSVYAIYLFPDASVV